MQSESSALKEREERVFGPLGISPLGDRIMVKPKDMNIEKTASGIYIPESAKKDAPVEGRVVAIGTGIYKDGKLMPLSVRVGDKVLFSRYGYDEVKIDGTEYFMLKEESILAIIK